MQAKRKLLDDCDLWAVVSLSSRVFIAAGAGVKTNLLFFTKGSQTQKVWYYDMSDVKVTKTNPLTLAHFEEFFRVLPKKVDNEHSWKVTREELEAKGLDIKAVNPNAKVEEERKTPDELLDIIEAKQKEIMEALSLLGAR